jgi:Fibronectin type III domain
MQHHKLDFRNKTHLEQIGMCDRLIAGADTLPEEQRRQIVQLENLRAHAAAARASHERIAVLRAQLKSEVSHRREILARARNAATGTALGISLATNYQPAAMMAAGLELAAPNTAPVGKPGAPSNLRAEATDKEGEVRLRWQRTVRRCTFDVQWHTDPPDADHWHPEDSCTKAKTLVKGLVSGAKYWFRVRATNAHGQGPWSQMASARAK